MPPRRGRQSSAGGGGGAPGYDFIKIFRKLHEIKENSMPGRGHVSPAPSPLRSATDIFLIGVIRQIQRLGNLGDDIGGIWIGGGRVHAPDSATEVLALSHDIRKSRILKCIRVM